VAVLPEKTLKRSVVSKDKFFQLRFAPRRYALSALLFILAAGCSSRQAAEDVQPSEQVFLMLGSLGSLLKFPASQDVLDECVKKKDQTCLELYAAFRTAVLELFEDGRPAALKRTLTAVRTTCRTPEQVRGTVSRWQSCRGAVTAFYFFSNDAEDRTILAHLSTLEPIVLRNALLESHGYAGDWVSNRPDRQRWIAFLGSASTLQDDGIANVFVSPPKPHTGIELLLPPQYPYREGK
jgi:hypothetical protein